MLARVPAILCAALLGLAGEARGEQAPPDPTAVARELQSNEEALGRLRDRATSVLDELAAAERELRGLEAGADAAEASLRAATERVEAAQRDEDAARAALLAQLDALAPRLRARYALGRQRRVNLMMSARSVGEVLWRKRALEAVLAGDLALLGEAQAGLERLEARRRELAELRSEVDRRTAAARERRARAERRKADLAALLESVLAEQGLREKTLKELYQVHRQLSKLVEGLPTDASDRRFARRRGQLPFPAKGSIEVGFGKVLNARFNTVTFQKGIDLRAPFGAEVISVAPGKVVHAGPFRGYGNLVIVDHGEGYHSLYAHLANIERAVGDQVEESEVIGKVGDSGSLKGAYLYFELREKGKPVNPQQWLGAP